MSLRTRPLRHQHFDVTFPHERVVQVTLNRPEKLNAINQATSRAIAQVWEWFDQDETLWVGVITGVGRAFCTGADLQGGRLGAQSPAEHERTRGLTGGRRASQSGTR